MLDHFTSLINALAQQTGSEDISVDEGGTSHFFFDNLAVIVQYLDVDHMMYLFSAIGEVPKEAEPRLKLYSRLLEANCHYKETAGFVLAVDEKANYVALQHMVSLTVLDESSFLEVLELYLQMAEYWRAVVAGEESDDSPEEQGQEPLSTGWVLA